MKLRIAVVVIVAFAATACGERPSIQTADDESLSHAVQVPTRSADRLTSVEVPIKPEAVELPAPQAAVPGRAEAVEVVEPVTEIDTGATAGAAAVRVSPPSTLPAIHGLAQTELDATYNARQCIIDEESRHSGMYVAENGGTPADEPGPSRGTASGAYQWINSSWTYVLPNAELFYGLVLISPEEELAGARGHAAFASPYAQDLVTAFALLHRDLNQSQRPWTYSWCWNKVGSIKQLREDGPEHAPTPFIQGQI